VQTLEKRLLFATAPATPRADTLGAVFDATERQTLLNRMTNLSSTERSTLQTDLNKSLVKFDNALLNYMRARSNVNFYFDPANTSAIGSFIKNNNISYTQIQTDADAVVNHLFPAQSSSTNYDVQLPASINWVKPGGSSNAEFLHTLNWQAYWEELAWTNAINPDPKYANELNYELSSWSQQFQTLATPTAWSVTDQSGWLLDMSTQGETWTWAYFGFLNDANFSGAENSLFMYKLLQHGDFLYSNALTTTDFTSNRDIALAKGLLLIADMFPEFDNDASWQTAARNLMFTSMNTQIFPDGSQYEQSPGYAENVADDVLEAKQLDQLNGHAWPSSESSLLSKLVTSYWEFLSPDGTRPAIGDTYRTSSFGAFLKADIIQGTTVWPAAKPRARDVWVLGTSAVTPYVGIPASPASLGNRGDTYAMTSSGNYIMRSDNSTSARQIIFDAGPKGGTHGHYDLLNFELYGYGRPLISDPGAYTYDTSANRAYVVSTKAHNTLNADGLNVGDLEGAGNGSIEVSQWDAGANSTQITATHWGYEYLPGQPVLTRSMWYDNDGTILIVDWAEGNTSHNYQDSFNLQTLGVNGNVSVDDTTFTAQTKYSSGGNVKIQALSRPGQTAAKGPLTFVTNQASGNFMDPAYRFTVNQSGSFVCFVTLITAYNGTTAPNTTATLMNTPTAGGMVKVQLTKGGVSQEVDFTPTTLQHLNATASSRGTYNDIAYDSAGNLNMVYADRDTGDLMYAVRATSGKWSIPQIIDPPAVTPIGAGGYQYISVALDSHGNPGVAYFDGWNGNLKYAYFDPTAHAWQTQTVDSKGSTGLYPSLIFSRHDGAVISYYNHGKGDLDLATQQGSGFTIETLDSTGDVGRFSSIVLDPNRPTATKFAIGYEDTSNGNYKFTLQGLFNGGTQIDGYTNYTVDNLQYAGGYVSLAYYDSKSNDDERYKPAMSYYDAANSALRFAMSSDRGSTWSTQAVATANVQGLYTSLFFDSTGRANILYFNRTGNTAIRAILTGKKWAFTTISSGGREMHVSLAAGGGIAYSELDESIGELDVKFL
jgi:hypothetical protein